MECTSYLQAARAQQVAVPIPTKTWPETRGRLAAALPPGDFATLALAYAKLTALQLAWGELLPSIVMGSDGVHATQEVMERVEAATIVLVRHAWPSKAEQEALLKYFQEEL